MSPRVVRSYIAFSVLAGPALMLRTLTSVYPVAQTLYLSLFQSNLMTRTHRYVGLANFASLARDETVTEIVVFTLMFVIVSTALQLSLGIAIASLLNAQFRGRRLMRTINLIPWAIPTVVAGMAFRWMLDDQYGLIIDWVNRVFGSRPAPLIFPVMARTAVVLVNVWKNVPFMAVVLLAGLQSVPTELYEAARIDGASVHQTFRWVTIPLIMPVAVTLILFFLVWQLASFDLIYGMTHGGPGVATTVIAYRIFQKGMLWYDWGMASAMSVMLVAIVALVGVMGLWLFRRYEVTL